MMIEGGKIDWLCHANDAAAAIHETMALDNAVRKAYEFAQKHPDETLIVVTGDHETGGMTMGFAGTGYKLYINRLSGQKVTGGVFAHRFRQKIAANPKLQFDDVKELIFENFGLKTEGDAKKDPMVLSSHELARVQQAFRRSLGSKDYAPSEDRKLLYGGSDPLTVTLLHILANKAGVAWTTFAHSALPVNTTAYGVNADHFSGMLDNTDIARKLKAMLPAAK